MGTGFVGSDRAVVGPADDRARRPRRRQPRRFHRRRRQRATSKFVDEPQQRTGGDGETDIEIVLPSLLLSRRRNDQRAARPHPAVRHVGRRARDLLGAAPNLRIRWNAPRRSRRARSAVQRSSSARESRCAHGTPVTIPFAVPLPEDAPPTAEAVHSSLVWFLEATLILLEVDPGHRNSAPSDSLVVNAP